MLYYIAHYKYSLKTFVKAERTKKMKKLLTMVGAAAVAASAMVANAADTEVSITTNGVAWRISLHDDGRTATLGKDGCTSANSAASYRACPEGTDTDAANIPWTFTYDGTSYTITAVAAYACHSSSGKSSLTGTLTIPYEVVSIGDNAFRRAGASRLVWGGGVAVLGSSAFADMASLTGTFPDLTAVETLGQSVFSNTGLTGTLRLGSEITTLDVAFQNCNLTGAAIVPANVTTIIDHPTAGKGTFYNNPNLAAIWIKGAATGVTTVGCRSFAGSCTSLKMILMGQNTESSSLSSATGTKAMLYQDSNVDMFVPANGHWDGLVTGGANNKVWYYGATNEFNLAIDDTKMTATFTPTTENAFSNIISWASTFKSAFDLDTVVAITNRIEMTEGVEITEAMLQNVTLEAPPWYLTFAVKNQTQLNNVLAAVSADVPIIIDIEGAGKNQITVPNGRKVAILAKSGWTFGKKLNGLIISFY